MDLRLEAYFREVDNPWTRYDNLYNRWVLLPELQGDRYLLEPEHAQTLGFEASVTANRSARWSLNGSYALADATEQVQGSKTHRPWQQKHTLKASLRWQSTRWHFGLATHYRSGWPVTGLPEFCIG